jgi:hypothetical protein
MAPSKQYDEGGQLQLMEPDRVEEEEECFESIDKRKSRRFPPLSPPPDPPISSPMPRLLACSCAHGASRACDPWGLGTLSTCVPVASASRLARFGRDLVLFRGESDAGVASVRASFCCVERVLVLR